MITRIKLNIKDAFITEPIHRDSLLKCLASEHPSVLHRLYLLKNELKEEQHFMELDDSTFQCSARLKQRFAYAGKARQQADTVSFMKPRLKEQPHWEIVFKIYEKVGMKSVFEFNHKCSNIDEIISLIDKLEQKTIELCQNKASMY